jgi:hypothetical protein
MTATKLQDVVRVLANGAWCRYWMNWNKDAIGRTIMAVQCRDEKGRPQQINDAQRHGFAQHNDFFYTVPRTNEDGTDYATKLDNN